MKYPYERFLRFLVSRKIEIHSTLDGYELPRVGDLWLADCRQHLRDHAPPAMVAFVDAPELELADLDGVLDWADAEGFGDLWRMQNEFGRAPAAPAFDLAFRLFVNVHTRAILGCALLSTATDKEIQTLLFGNFGIDLSGEALATYRHLFWDVTMLSRKEWGEFPQRLVTAEERSYVAFGLRAPSIDEIRDMLGMDTPNTDEHVVNTIITKAFTKFRIAMDEINPEEAGAIRWAELALRAIGTKKTAGLSAPKDGGPAMGDFQALFSVKPEKSAHLTLAQLAGHVAIPKKPVPNDKDS
ncbi:MAG: hypothetical protein KBF21_07605 [Thermoanaerobaculia bacterium]|nr:hypothetical protein [Thermoanaerobaculia bacterium]